MTPRLEKASNIIKWAIDNKCTLINAMRTFQVNERYLRTVSHECKDQEGYKEFTALYNKFRLGKIDSLENTVTDEDLLGEDKEIDSPYLNFQKDQQGRGVLDARGKSHVKTLDALVREAKIDLEVWNIDRHVINKWDVTNAGGATFQNWQVKAWLTKRQAIEDAKNADEFFKELLGRHKPFVYKPVKHAKKKENNLLEISVYDAHIGKLCWNGETGEDYDTKIAARRFMEAIQKSIQRVSGNDFSKILFVVGNDFFNSDTILNTTTSGTPQDEDLRWKKTFKIGFKLLVEGIDYMRQFANVDVLVIPGNHDEQRSYFAGCSLEAWYRNDSNVNIDNSAPIRKYYRHGKVLIGLSHGDKEKENMMPQLMAYEAKKDWAETEYHEWHLGHLHKKKADKYKVPIYNEELAVIIRRLSSISGTDNWHFSKGYKGTMKAAEAFLWSDVDGLMGHYNVTVNV